MKSKKASTSGESYPRPYKGHTVYLDVSNDRQATSLERDLRILGAKIEKCFSKDVSLVVCDNADTTAMEGGVSRIPSPSPSPQNPSPYVRSGGTVNRSHSPGTSANLNQLSRAAKMLSSANVTKNQGTSNILKSAGRLNIPVISCTLLKKKLAAQLAKVPNDVKYSSEKGKALEKRKIEQGHRVKMLTGKFIKFEDASRHYRPLKQEVNAWPMLHLNVTSQGCPFELEKGQGNQAATEEEVERADAPGALGKDGGTRDAAGNDELNTTSTAQRDAKKSATSKKSIPAKSTNQMSTDKAAGGKKTGEMGAAKIPRGTTRDREVDYDTGLPKLYTAGELRRIMIEKRRAEKNRGYCEMCNVKYEDINKHLSSDGHRAFARNQDNFTDLDAMIKTGPNMEKFLTDVITYHEQHMKEGLQESEMEDEVLLIKEGLVSPLVKPKRASFIRIHPQEHSASDSTNTREKIKGTEGVKKLKVQDVNSPFLKKEADSCSTAAQPVVRLFRSPVRTVRRSLALSPESPVVPNRTRRQVLHKGSPQNSKTKQSLMRHSDEKSAEGNGDEKLFSEQLQLSANQSSHKKSARLNTGKSAQKTDETESIQLRTQESFVKRGDVSVTEKVELDTIREKNTSPVRCSKRKKSLDKESVVVDSPMKRTRLSERIGGKTNDSFSLPKCSSNETKVHHTDVSSKAVHVERKSPTKVSKSVARKVLASSENSQQDSADKGETVSQINKTLAFTPDSHRKPRFIRIKGGNPNENGNSFVSSKASTSDLRRTPRKCVTSLQALDKCHLPEKLPQNVKEKEFLSTSSPKENSLNEKGARALTRNRFIRINYSANQQERSQSTQIGTLKRDSTEKSSAEVRNKQENDEHAPEDVTSSSPMRTPNEAYKTPLCRKRRSSNQNSPATPREAYFTPAIFSGDKTPTGRKVEVVIKKLKVTPSSSVPTRPRRRLRSQTSPKTHADSYDYERSPQGSPAQKRRLLSSCGTDILPILEEQQSQSGTTAPVTKETRQAKIGSPTIKRKRDEHLINVPKTVENGEKCDTKNSEQIEGNKFSSPEMDISTQNLDKLAVGPLRDIDWSNIMFDSRRRKGSQDSTSRAVQDHEKDNKMELKKEGKVIKGKIRGGAHLKSEGGTVYFTPCSQVSLMRSTFEDSDSENGSIPPLLPVTRKSSVSTCLQRDEVDITSRGTSSCDEHSEQSDGIDCKKTPCTAPPTLTMEAPSLSPIGHRTPRSKRALSPSGYRSHLTANGETPPPVLSPKALNLRTISEASSKSVKQVKNLDPTGEADRKETVPPVLSPILLNNLITLLQQGSTGLDPPYLSPQRRADSKEALSSKELPNLKLISKEMEDPSFVNSTRLLRCAVSSPVKICSSADCVSRQMLDIRVQLCREIVDKRREYLDQSIDMNCQNMQKSYTCYKDISLREINDNKGAFNDKRRRLNEDGKKTELNRREHVRKASNVAYLVKSKNLLHKKGIFAKGESFQKREDAVLRRKLRKKVKKRLDTSIQVISDRSVSVLFDSDSDDYADFDGFSPSDEEDELDISFRNVDELDLTDHSDFELVFDDVFNDNDVFDQMGYTVDASLNRKLKEPVSVPKKQKQNKGVSSGVDEERKMTACKRIRYLTNLTSRQLNRSLQTDLNRSLPNDLNRSLPNNLNRSLRECGLFVGISSQCSEDKDKHLLDFDKSITVNTRHDSEKRDPGSHVTSFIPCVKDNYVARLSTHGSKDTCGSDLSYAREANSFTKTAIGGIRNIVPQDFVAEFSSPNKFGISDQGLLEFSPEIPKIYSPHSRNTPLSKRARACQNLFSKQNGGPSQDDEPTEKFGNRTLFPVCGEDFQKEHFSGLKQSTPLRPSSKSAGSKSRDSMVAHAENELDSSKKPFTFSVDQQMSLSTSYPEISETTNRKFSTLINDQEQEVQEDFEEEIVLIEEESSDSEVTFCLRETLNVEPATENAIDTTCSSDPNVIHSRNRSSHNKNTSRIISAANLRNSTFKVNTNYKKAKVTSKNTLGKTAFPIGKNKFSSSIQPSYHFLNIKSKFRHKTPSSMISIRKSTKQRKKQAKNSEYYCSSEENMSPLNKRPRLVSVPLGSKTDLSQNGDVKTGCNKSLRTRQGRKSCNEKS